MQTGSDRIDREQACGGGGGIGGEERSGRTMVVVSEEHVRIGM